MQRPLLLLLCAAIVACGDDDTTADGGLDAAAPPMDAGAPLPDVGMPETAEELRDAILITAEAARTECDGDDNDPAIRERLSTWADRLVALGPDLPEGDKVDLVVGEWEQLWSDAPFSELPGFCYVGDRMWQLVFAEGYYYNLANVENRREGVRRNFVRGVFTVEPESLAVEFTDAYFAEGMFDESTDLTAAALAAEAGEVERGDPSFPPVGSSARLKNLYVDEVLRITTDGASASDSSNIFVMRRVD